MLISAETIDIKGFKGDFMIEKCYNKTHNKALRDGNLKGLLINNSLLGVIMTVSNNTRNIERGQSRKPHLMYGVAYNSRGKHKTKIKGTRKSTVVYQAWFSMIVRCYSKKTQSRQPAYIGCTVDDRWLDFQVFAEWYENHPYSGLGYQLDKDLLTPNNKVYSAENCTLLPQELNKILTDNHAVRGYYPQGVTYDKKWGRYQARISMDSKSKSLGWFDCPSEAYQAYKKTKERYVKNKALEWANRIEWGAFVALMNWSLPNV